MAKCKIIYIKLVSCLMQSSLDDLLLEVLIVLKKLNKILF
jgi:hypothetical protein